MGEARPTQKEHLATAWRALATAREHPIWVWTVRTWRGFFAHRNLVNASALTFSTMLAVVPLVAVVLSALKASGFAYALRPFLREQFPVLGAPAVEALIAYIDRANEQAVGGVGFAALLITSWSMLGNVESSLNHIFGLTGRRGIARRTGEYLSMLLVGAVLVVASIAGRTLLSSDTLQLFAFGDELIGGVSGLLIRALPWLTAWTAFFLLYTWMPNRSVPWRSALFGAIVGGSLFQLVQLSYIELQLGFGSYHAVYGALAQLPILLIWVYLSWIVVLVGAEGISARSALSEKPLPPSERFGASLIALASLREVLRAFELGERTPGPDQLAVRLGVSAQEVRQALAPLLRAEILVEPDPERGYLPAASPKTVSIERLLQALR